MIKKINLTLILVMLIGTLYFVLFSYDGSRLLTYLAVVPVLAAPCIFCKIKYRLRDFELLIYYIFIFLADFLGCVVNLYNLVGWYDLFTHFLSGIFTFWIGIFILDKIQFRGKNILFELFFSISVVMLVASVWEFFEFGADILLDMDLQHHMDTGVVDTMTDMLVAFLGGILSIGGYYLLQKRTHFE